MQPCGSSSARKDSRVEGWPRRTASMVRRGVRVGGDDLGARTGEPLLQRGRTARVAVDEDVVRVARGGVAGDERRTETNSPVSSTQHSPGPAYVSMYARAFHLFFIAAATMCAY